MKKNLFTLIILLILPVMVYANENSFFTPEISIGTGVSIYDDKADTARKSILDNKDYKRIIVGVTADTDLNLSDTIKIILGAEIFSDFLWKGKHYYNSSDYAFFTGIKIFPNIAGLNFSIAYTLGNRTDYYCILTEEQQSVTRTDSKSWGNGFRLAVQYNFMQERNYKVKPNVGAYYRCVPRGNYNTDHSLSIYAGVRF